MIFESIRLRSLRVYACSIRRCCKRDGEMLTILRIRGSAEPSNCITRSTSHPSKVAGISGEFPAHAIGSTHSKHTKKRYCLFGSPEVRRNRMWLTGDPYPSCVEESSRCVGIFERSKKNPRKTASMVSVTYSADDHRTSRTKISRTRECVNMF
jgi:hypothetical protein